MKVIVSSYPVAFQCPGGGEIQLLRSIEALEKQDIDVIRFDPWTTQLSDADVVHYFSVQGGSSNFCNYVYGHALPLVISPIIWLGDNPEVYPIDEIGHLLTMSDIICPNSHAEAAQLSRYFNLPAEKFFITHNGVDEIFTQNVEASLFRNQFSISESFILCVANIEPRKNQLNLIKAVNALKKKLVLIGNIRDKSYYDKCMEIADSNVQYLGYIDHHDPLLRSAYDACEVFALPSTLETPGLAALEAAASNARIVITEIGATQEYFGDYAFYVSPASHDSIRDGILKAISSPPPPPLNVYARYSWRNTADELIKAYQKALQSRQSSSF